MTYKDCSQLLFPQIGKSMGKSIVGEVVHLGDECSQNYLSQRRDLNSLTAVTVSTAKLL